MTVQSPSNYVLITVNTKFVGNLSKIMQLSAIQNGSSVDPTDFVNIVGEVVSVPKMISDSRDFKGFSTKDIQVGDTAIFSCNVIYDLQMTEDETADPIYKNRVWYHGKEYWTCDIRNLFAVIRNGEIIMVNGYAMVVPPPENKIVVAQTAKKARLASKSGLINIGNPLTHQPQLTAQAGENVFFSATKAAPYKIKDKRFSIIQQNHLLCREVEK